MGERERERGAECERKGFGKRVSSRKN